MMHDGASIVCAVRLRLWKACTTPSNTILHGTWSWYRLGVAELLLDRGANVHAAGEDALYQAAKGGHLAIVRLLLSRGANAAACPDAIPRAVERGHVEVAEALRSAARPRFSAALRRHAKNLCNAARDVSFTGVVHGKCALACCQVVQTQSVYVVPGRMLYQAFSDVGLFPASTFDHCSGKGGGPTGGVCWIMCTLDRTSPTARWWMPRLLAVSAIMILSNRLMKTCGTSKARPHTYVLGPDSDPCFCVPESVVVPWGVQDCLQCATLQPCGVVFQYYAYKCSVHTVKASFLNVSRVLGNSGSAKVIQAKPELYCRLVDIHLLFLPTGASKSPPPTPC
eukprot:353872-Chlamydomonas_euryale.AAC.13